MATDTLTPKQEKYVQGLFKGLSQREAYKAAYNCENMSDKTVDEAACRAYGDSKILARLKELQDEFKANNMLTKEWVLKNLREVAERCMQAEPVMVRKGNKTIESGEYTFQANGANKSLELIGKHLGMFTDKIEMSGSVGNPYKELSVDELKTLANKPN